MLKVTNGLWLISDTHFGHRNIVKFQQRPASHEIIMLSEWAKRVSESDQILHLGDVWMKSSAWRWAAIIARLPGEKFLIRGNHDNDRDEFYERAGFTLIEPFIHRDVAFTHRPVTNEFPVWAPNGRLNGNARAQFLMSGIDERDAAEGWSVNIHGHTHNNPPFIGEGSEFAGKTYVNVCVEKTGLAPRRLGEIYPLPKF